MCAEHVGAAETVTSVTTELPQVGHLQRNGGRCPTPVVEARCGCRCCCVRDVMATYLKQIALLFASDFWACGRPPRRGENVKIIRLECRGARR